MSEMKRRIRKLSSIWLLVRYLSIMASTDLLYKASLSNSKKPQIFRTMLLSILTATIITSPLSLFKKSSSCERI